MSKRAMLFLALGGLLATSSAFAQGATGAISRPGWSRGSAPSSDFNAQGSAMTRTEVLRQRAAAAQNQRRPARRTRR